MTNNNGNNVLGLTKRVIKIIIAMNNEINPPLDKVRTNADTIIARAKK